MNDQFVYTAQAARVVFGPGVLAQLGDEVTRLGWQRVMVISTARQEGKARALAALLGDRLVAVHAGAEMHVPRASVTPAVAQARTLLIDGLVCYGGGSTIGLAKAIALETRLPILALPTTYAGSEMTAIYGITEDGLKRTGNDPVVLPRVVLYDPELTMDLPAALSTTSGLNAMAHAAEGLYARDANPVTTLLAEEALRCLAQSLPTLSAQPHDRPARALALQGAWLSGTVLGSVGMALHHKLCHTLGGSFGLPHAETHAVVLPHALAYNAPCAAEAMQRLARALGVQNGPLGVYNLLLQLKLPTSLQALGLPASALDRVCDLALSNPYWNPRPLEREALRASLERAWAGHPPATS